MIAHEQAYSILAGKKKGMKRGLFPLVKATSKKEADGALRFTKRSLPLFLTYTQNREGLVLDVPPSSRNQERMYDVDGLDKGPLMCSGFAFLISSTETNVEGKDPRAVEGWRKDERTSGQHTRKYPRVQMKQEPTLDGQRGREKKTTELFRGRSRQKQVWNEQC
jgi:hypothetical protein